MPKDRVEEKHSLSQYLSDNPDITSVTVAVFDLAGNPRGKRIPITAADQITGGGVRMPLSAMAADIWGTEIDNCSLIYKTGDADGMLLPGTRGVLPTTWSSDPSVFLPAVLHNEDKTPFLGDPRNTLAAIVERFKTLELTPVIATELEFYFYDPSSTHPQPPLNPRTGKQSHANDCFSVSDLSDFGPIIEDIYKACHAQDVPADSAISEAGCGQFEINLMHLPDPLRSADNAVFFKRIVKGVAQKYGLGATFMAKPYGDLPGSGFHVHFSLLNEDGDNIFNDGTDKGSPLLQYAIGGLISAMPETTILFAPHFNSYRRLRPGGHAPAAQAWGYENRTTALRIPGGAPEARRIEHRVAGADANPYLVLSAILGATLYGLENQIQPPPEVIGDAHTQLLPPLPYDWGSALVAFENGKIAEGFLNPIIHEIITSCKHQEMKAFAKNVSDFEYKSYLESV